MQYNTLGRTGVKVSALCYGTMAFGGDADEATSGQMYRYCRELGINFFDTANVYSNGRSEEILGRLIQGERRRVGNHARKSAAQWATAPTTGACRGGILCRP